MTTRLAIVMVGVVALGACSRPVPAAGLHWQTRFGPVIADEVIVGRVPAGDRVWLMTTKDALVSVDLRGGRHTRLPVSPLRAGEHVWGLAATGAGAPAFWTLTGRRELARLSEDGRIEQRLPLDDAHVAVYSGVRELVYQVVNMLPPADALVAGPPGTAPRRAWSTMRTRPLAMNRGEAAALNLVSCGASEHDAIACWFSDQASVTLTDAAGASTHVPLEALNAVEPEVLLQSPVPRRPIADVWVSRAGELWALTSDAAYVDSAERRGALVLGRYRRDGSILKRVPLPEPARLILGVTGDKCVLLSWDGRVVEVQP